jgi:hypothetical protein
LDQGPIRLESQDRVLELDALIFVFVCAAFQAFYPALLVLLSSVRRFSELSEIIEVSISCQPVFYFSFDFSCCLSSSETLRRSGQVDCPRSANYKNTVTAQKLPRSLGFFKNYDLQWLGLDSAGHRLFAVIKRLDCAPTYLGLAYIGSGAKLFTAHSEYRAFHFSASRRLICDFLRVTVNVASCNQNAC